jgi:predicted nucleotidyltransferase
MYAVRLLLRKPEVYIIRAQKLEGMFGKYLMETEHVLKGFREEVEKLYGQRLKNIILYGSCARGKATEDSDIDLAIVLAGDVSPGKEIDRIIDIVTEINLRYNVLISVYPVSERNYDTVNSPLLLNLRREGIPV